VLSRGKTVQPHGLPVIAQQAHTPSMAAMVEVIALFLVGAIAAWRGSRHMDRIFRLQGDYSAGPRPYPDQDP
jgi:hypothetical protein